MNTAAAKTARIGKVKQRIAGYVCHLSLGDIQKLGDRSYRRDWLTTRFGVWGQDLERYLARSLARRVKQLQYLR